MYRRNILLFVGLAASLALPATGAAQFAGAQDSTLAGLQKVFVQFTDMGGALGGATAEALRNSAILELRKAGLRVAKDRSELGREDAVLNISFITTPRAISVDLSFRMDLEQLAQLERTKQSTLMVTWYYEKSALNTIVKDVAQPMLTKGVNEFLNKWLDFNGR